MIVYKAYVDYGNSYVQFYQSNDLSVGAILSPNLQLDTNKAGGFDFIILPGNPAYDMMKEMQSFIYVLRDDKYIFRGRVSNVKTDIFKQRSVTCEGDLAILGDSIQSPNTFYNIQDAGNTGKKQKVVTKNNVQMTVENFFRSIIQTHNNQMSEGRKQFTVGSVTISQKNVTETFSLTSYGDTASTLNNELLSVYGGIFRTRYENSVPYIDWLDSYTESNNQQINFGVNLISLDEEQPNNDIWSVLLPIGKNGITISSVNNGSNFLSNTNAVNRYGKIVHYHKFEDATTASVLLSKAQAYLDRHSQIFPNNLKVKAIDLVHIGQSNDPLEIGDRIRVISSPHGIDQTMACLEAEIDLMNPENSTYTIGTILPLEEKKRSITSQHSSGSRSYSRSSNSFSDSLDYLGSDLAATEKNVNVNAENIAVNAKNIAITAENLAVVAENITVAAQTIDIKAENLTATFEDETSDLITEITAKAGEIKSHITSKTGDVSSTVTQTQNSWTASITGAKNDIISQISLTEDGLISEFNKKIDGYTDDSGVYHDGVVQVLNHNIETTAAGTIETINKNIYLGNDGTGTPTNPAAGTLLATHGAEIVTTAENYTSTYTSTFFYGEGPNGEIGDPNHIYSNGVWYSQSQINQTSNAIKLMVYGSGDPTSSSSSPSSDSIMSMFEVTGTGTRTMVYKGGKIVTAINANTEGVQIQASKVDLGDYATARTIAATYATIDSLETTNARVYGLLTASDTVDARLVYATGQISIGKGSSSSGSAAGRLFFRGREYFQKGIKIGSNSFYFLGDTDDTTFDLNHSHALSVDANGNLVVGAAQTGSNGSYGLRNYIRNNISGVDSFSARSITAAASTNGNPVLSIGDSQNGGRGSFYLQGTQYLKHLIKVGNVASGYYLGSGSSDLDLDHSHSVSVANNGTVTLGSAVATNASGRSFNIADTKKYKDGVSAVGIRSISQVANSLNYLGGTNRIIQVDVLATANNSDVVSSATDNTKTVTLNIFGTSAYNDGVDSVTVSSLTRTQNDVYNSSTHNSAVYVTATASNSKTKEGVFYVSGSDAYNDGVSSVTVSSAGKDVTSQGVPREPAYSSSNNNYTVYVRGTASNGNYKAGTFTFTPTDAINSVTVSSLTRTQSDTYNSSTHVSTIYITGTASNNNTKEGVFYVSGSDAYNDGVDSVTVSSVGKDVTSQGVPREPAYSSSNNNYTVYVRGTASNGDYKSSTFTFTPTAAVNSVSVTTLGRRHKTNGDVYDATFADNRYAIPIEAKLSNNKSDIATIYVYATEAINSVTVSSVGFRYGVADTYNSSTHVITVPVVATASNGKTKDADLDINGAPAYNDGYSNGQNAVYIVSVGQQVNSQGVPIEATFYSNSDNPNPPVYGVHIMATASNTAQATGTIYVSAASAYNLGVSDARSNASISAVTIASNGTAYVTVSIGGSARIITVDSSKVVDQHT